MTAALIPVFTGTLAENAVQLCDARTLHDFMKVKRDFSNWIKGRVRKFCFVAGEDFIAIARSPELASGNRGASIDYHLTLDMAKELSMVENNEQGRAARRYFIECERKALAQLPTARPFNPTIDYDRISPAQAQDLKEIVDAIVRAGVQGHGETWSRLHKKFRVNSYLQLAATRHTEARQYLIGKLPYGYATGDVQHEPTAQALSDQVARWVRQLETDNGAMVEVFMPIYRAVRKQVERPGTLNVDRRKLAAIWVDLGKLKSRVDGLGVLESDLPPSWWAANAISQN